MTTRPGDGQLTWNVAGLLADGIGADRQYPVQDARPSVPEGLTLAEPVTGTIRLARTNRGILLDGRLATALATECSRCLRPIVVPLDLDIEEEFLPSIDLVSGQPVADADEPDAQRLSDHHEVDLEASVVDAIVMAEPIAPLCRPDCPGLCPVCGVRLDEGSHDHPDGSGDPRMEVLRTFLIE